MNRTRAQWVTNRFSVSNECAAVKNAGWANCGAQFFFSLFFFQHYKQTPMNDMDEIGIYEKSKMNFIFFIVTQNVGIN